MNWYLRYNAPRYAWTLPRLERRLNAIREQWPGEELHVLDVAKSFQTELIRGLVPDGRVDDVGYNDARVATDPRGRHIEFDLNRVREREAWPAIDGYHLVVIAEVIEHLSVGPVSLLSFLAGGLVPGGYLWVQTPNSVALHKRLRKMIGRSDVAPPDEEHDGVSHLHEYTIAELCEAGERAGLRVVEVDGANYFGTGRAARAYVKMGRALPRSMRHGLVVTYQRPH